MNSLNLTGRLTKDAEYMQYKNPKTGKVGYRVRSTMAVDREVLGKDGKKETDFIPVQSWITEPQKEKFFEKNFKKGALVSLKGSMRVENYQDKETKQNRTFTLAQGTFEFLAHPQNRNQNGQDNIQSQNSYDESQVFEPQFEPEGFSAINDDDIPF